MRKYGCSKRNPDPKWPCEQTVVVVPPGSSSETAAKLNGTLKSMATFASSTPHNTGNLDTVRLREENAQGNSMIREGNMLRDSDMTAIEDSAMIREGSLIAGDGNVPIKDDNTQIMGYMPDFPSMPRQGRGTVQRNDCSKVDVASYLCGNVGSYARVEFLFGENTHVEKTGVLESVGRDFIVLTEAGTGTQIVSSLKNIKFINLYKINNS